MSWYRCGIKCDRMSAIKKRWKPRYWTVMFNIHLKDINLMLFHLILSGTLWVWLPSVTQFPAKLVPLAPPYSLLSAMAPCVRTETPLAMRRRGSSRHPWGRTVNKALGRPSTPIPERPGPTANHMCEGVAWPESHAARKICSASSCEQYRSRTW